MTNKMGFMNFWRLSYQCHKLTYFCLSSNSIFRFIKSIIRKRNMEECDIHDRLPLILFILLSKDLEFCPRTLKFGLLLFL